MKEEVSVAKLGSVRRGKATPRRGDAVLCTIVKLALQHYVHLHIEGRKKWPVYYFSRRMRRPGSRQSSGEFSLRSPASIGGQSGPVENLEAASAGLAGW